MSKRYRAKIVGVGAYLPERIMTNKHFEEILDTSDEWIRSRTGITERRIAENGMSCSDLGSEAARCALKNADLLSKEIDLILVATITPDMVWPATACIIQKKIAAVNAAAFDLSAGCTGFIYALATATQFIETGAYKNILIIGVEILSRIINWEDRATSVLFGDGAGAIILQASLGTSGVVASYLGSDGRGVDLLKQPAGGTTMPASIQSIDNKLHAIHMNGNEVFKFAVRILEEATNRVLEMSGYKMQDIDLLIPHQANIRIVEAALKRLNINKDRVLINLNLYGNMSSASIPVALYQAYLEKKLTSGKKVLLVGFGAGLTWGSTIINC